MAYNKSKHVETAQKLLHQGKVAQAIAEYQQILKHEPTDQVTLMTVGELFIRQGETFQAIEYFERLAQIFANDGFMTKAIAVYKRIAKLAPEEIRPLEKLAELYVQQGVMSEARPLYLQLAEIQLKNNKQADAVALLKKLLAAEPDNLRIQVRLADLYQAMGQSKDALEAYVGAAERVLARGDHAECEKLADKALKIEAHHLAAMTVKARACVASGKIAQAAQLLVQVPGLEKGGEQADLLLDLCLKNAKWDEATTLAIKVFENDQKNFGLAQKVCESLLQAGEAERVMTLVEKVRIPMIDAGEHEAITSMLTTLATKLPGRLEPLEWLVDSYGRMSDSFRMPDALAQLGDAVMAAGEFQRAKEVFEQLVERQPESESARRKMNEILQKMGLIAEETIPMPAAVEAQELKSDLPQSQVRARLVEAAPEVREAKAAPPASAAEPLLDSETERFVTQSLTDVDLFASYGLTQKAISLLEAILRRAPRHTGTLEKLLDFRLGAGDERRTAELAAQIEQIYTERGDTRGAERFGELRRRFQRAAGLSDEQMAAAAAAPTVEAQPAEPEEAPAAAEQAPAAAPGVHEVDLSEEWSLLHEHYKPSETDAPPKEAAPPEPPKAAPEPEVPAPADKEPAMTEFEIPVEEMSAAEEEEAPAPPAAAPPAATPVADAETPAEQHHEPEPETVEEYDLVLESEPTKAAGKEKPGPVFAADEFLAELASEIEQLGLGPLEPPAPAGAAAPAPTPTQPAAVSPPAETGPLSEVFEEFRAELGEMNAEDEDLETHYNLGVAFREMGLLEEAISEFQKVAKANDQGRAFRYALQCCTLLGLAFMEKGQPSIAAIWYERALQTPGIDSETMLALRYDLGMAQESAGDTEAALKSFSQVYANNIDYRDVADRIAALEKAAR